MCRKLYSLVMSVFVLSLVLASAAEAQDADLLGWWKLDEGNGTATADSSGNGFDGVLLGGPVWTDGFSGAALEFDGADDYVLCAARDGTRPGTYPEKLMPPDAFTVACWLRLNSFAYFSSFVGNGIDTGDDECGFFLYNSGWSGENGKDFGLAIRTETGMQYVETPNIYETGTWYHLAATYDGQNVIIYVNGAVAVGPEPVGGPVRWVSEVSGNYPERFAIGVWLDPGYDLWVDGAIDEVRYYGRALSKTEVKELAFRPKAHTPIPADGAIGLTQPLLQWQSGTSAMFHNVYLGTRAELTEADLVAARQPFAMYYHLPGLEPGVTYYWRVDEVESDMVTIHTGDLWSFTAMPLTAYVPRPADGSDDVAQSLTLGWLPGQGAITHHLYFADSFDAVNGGAAEADKGVPAETSFNTGLLRSGTTYYWRVDETNAAGETRLGDVWRFTTLQPVAGKIVREWWLGISGTTVSSLITHERFPGSPDGMELLNRFEGPVDWANNYGSRLSGWLVPPTSGEYTFWISSDDNSELWLSTDEDPANKQMIASVVGGDGWTDPRQWGKLPSQKSEPISLQAQKRYYIEALMKEGTGGDNIAVAWQPPGDAQDVIPGAFVNTFALAPRGAAAPFPANGAIDTIQAPILRWFPGEKAAQHDVYFGDDEAAVAGVDTSTAGIHRGRQAGTTYNPGALQWGKTYYWRIDEIDAGDAGSPWKGEVWSFSTADFILIDDFESYTDEMDAGEAIYQTWVDGAENGTGSYVGYEVANGGTFGEISIVYGGHQSMPLDYNNVVPPYYSETARTWDTPQDWTVNGVNALTLYVRGNLGNDADPLYVGVEDSAAHIGVAPYPDPTVVTSMEWVEWTIPQSDFSAAGVDFTAATKMYIGLGDRDAPTPGGAGLIYVDDIRATKLQQ